MYAMAEGKVEEFVSRYKTMLKHPVQSPKIKFAIEFIDDLLKDNVSDSANVLLSGAKIVLESYIVPDKKWRKRKADYLRKIADSEYYSVLIKFLNHVDANMDYLKKRMIFDVRN